uniref:Plant heme peroxidase family profile domain-containing protein n=1 Tax=Hemiselmis tepida TaxID=464990 RepID=A0A7S0VVP9_9CRYP|mmetsp:Transcript_2763/g.7061  ORF Transcript_2763/g.7061 Transcript_2763/m.7061 type:complete len:417 (+) Transcript_2763:38-1288(+)
MSSDPDGMDRVDVNVDALKSEIRRALISQKANACPIAMRMAWHAAGTYDKNTNTGGCKGGTMRFDKERSDPDNKGITIIQDLLLPVKQNHPEISHADLWAISAIAAIEFLGGPKIPFRFGRVDAPTDASCVPHSRLPDASQGADHLRQVFGRMGFNDREIVALSGGHTLGRCHEVRSGFDGPWTHNPLKFDNSYFRNLLELDWEPRKWNGRAQMQDKQSGKLMMLPTDMALKTDPKFRRIAEMYAKDEKLFFRDFSQAYSKLMCNGCPPHVDPMRPEGGRSVKDVKSAEFRDLIMHGSEQPARKLWTEGIADVHQLESTSGRTALHKAAFWEHKDIIKFLCAECKIDANVQDVYGDTALHDCAKFGHTDVAESLIVIGKTDTSLRNKEGKTAHDLAVEHGYKETANAIARVSKSRL